MDREVLNIRLLRGLCVASGVLSLVLPACGAGPKTYLQANISAATIKEAPGGYVVNVTILASDFEEMFQNTAAERRGVDLSGPGILEVEIGRFFAKRIAMRDRDGNSCLSKVEQAGEDPSNDEGVRVSLTFQCANRDIFYDASKFLIAHGARAWQVVTVMLGDNHRQVMVNAESPPVPVSAPQ
jgi:hypothetical protein